MTQFSITELSLLQKDMNEQQKLMFITQYSSEKKDRSVALILSLLLGQFGIDRFYVGDIGLGILKLFTLGFAVIILMLTQSFIILGLIGIVWLLDLLFIMERVDNYNRNKAVEIASAITGIPINILPNKTTSSDDSVSIIDEIL